MKSVLVPFPVAGGSCWCCRRRDDGVGWIVGETPLRIVWSCNTHVTMAKKAASMSAKEFDLYERDALLDAGAVAGEYLVSIGVTDMARLSPDQWDQFCRTMIDGFGESLERRLADHKAPF